VSCQVEVMNLLNSKYFSYQTVAINTWLLTDLELQKLKTKTATIVTLLH